MTGGVLVEETHCTPAADQPVEVVERKGTGHPDTICDAIAERISVALCRAYTGTFGRILHFNVDKGLLAAGRVECRPGGGRVVEPMTLIIGDRATEGLGARTIPVADLAVRTARAWLRRHLPHLHPERDVRYQVELRPGSAELSGIFSVRTGPPLANDTSAAVGYAPLTPTERLVLGLERFLNGPSFKRAFPETGQDVKVMAVRREEALSVIVAMPLLAEAVRSEATYFRRKTAIERAIQRRLEPQTARYRSLHVSLNALDRRGRGTAGMYLSLLGTSAEQGDSGEVGRGNRVCGVIALNRPASGEAAAGKNPVSHVGKIYNVLAQELANRIHERVEGLREATVWLCSMIGQPIDRPALASVQVGLARGMNLDRVRRPIEDIVREGLDGLGPFCRDLAEGRYRVY